MKTMACTTANVNKARTLAPSFAAQRSIFSTSRSFRGGVVAISPDISILVNGGNLVLRDRSDATVLLRTSFSSIFEGRNSQCFGWGGTIARVWLGEWNNTSVVTKIAAKMEKTGSWNQGTLAWGEREVLKTTYGRSDQHQGTCPVYY